MVLEQFVQDAINRGGYVRLSSAITNDYLDSAVDCRSNKYDSQICRVN